MVSSVNTNIDAMAAIASLNAIGNQMQSTQGAIESGLKVASASDNPAVFTIAQGLRANVSGLSAVSSSLATGVATLQGQSAGATSISNTLTTLLNTVTQAQGDTGTALAAANSTITAALSSIDSFANATTINGVNLLSAAGSVSVLSNQNGSTTSVATTAPSTSAGLGLSTLQTSSVGQAMSSTAILTLAGAASTTAGDSVTFTSNTGVATTYTFAAAAGAAGSNVLANGAIATAATELVAAINATATAEGSTTVATSAAGLLTITGGGILTGAGASGSATTYTASGGPATGEVFSFTPTGGSVQAFTLGGTTATTGYVTKGATTVATYQNLAAAMSAAGIAASANSTGVLTVAGGTITSSVATSTAASVSNGAVSIALVNNAITKIGQTLSALGSATTTLKGLADFTDQLSTSVTTSLGAMVDANLSQESAMLSSLQTKQSLAIQSLSLANQGPGALLQLFR
jgi:flagellin